MKINDSHKKYQNLRLKYPFFIFESFSYNQSENEISITFQFNISNQIFFSPTTKICIPPEISQINSIGKDALESLIFHMGMAELVSYWKATCAPSVIIRPFYLNKSQQNWWKKLYFNGLGEFFYVNQIVPSIEDFMTISCESTKKFAPIEYKSRNAYMVPVGGGKDSNVSLEILKYAEKEIFPMTINPNTAMTESIKASGIDQKNTIIIKRQISPELLKLNEAGYLNGHTPFSSVVAFSSILLSAITGINNIALSNESSANEPTVKGSDINHQYSKSITFESDFRSYVKNHLCSPANYFSLLRPLNELQIAFLFAQNSQYHSIFRSCNVGSKKGVWCGQCPKCLFVYIILSPFLSEKQMINIFNKNLLDSMDLINHFNELIGITTAKPFECVGTRDEIISTLNYLCAKGLKYELLNYYKTLDLYKESTSAFYELLKNLNGHHFLEHKLERLIKQQIHEKITFRETE